MSPDFKLKVIAICAELKIEPSWLMACMAFETGETFSPSIRNPNSSATGLIQFMADTAEGEWNITTNDLAKMTAVEQLEYVKKYFWRHRGRLKSLTDVYLVIFKPSGIKLAEHDPFIIKGERDYRPNAGLDTNKDGVITKHEIAGLVQKKYDRGMTEEFYG